MGEAAGRTRCRLPLPPHGGVAAGGIEGGTIIPRFVGSRHGHARASRDEAFLAIEVLPKKLSEFLADISGGRHAVAADAPRAVV